MYKKLLCLVVSIALSSCANIGPIYDKAPDVALPEKWEHANNKAYIIGDKQYNWWGQFDDSLLSDLIKEGQSNNLDLKSAFFRIKKAKSLYGSAYSYKYPNIDLVSSSNRIKSSKSTTGRSSVESYENLNLSSSWEIDLFGRIEKQVEVSRNNIKYSREDYRDLITILNSNIASTYIEIRTLQNRLKIANKNIAVQEKTFDLVRAKYDAELVSRIDWFQAKQNLESSRAIIPQINSILSRSLNRLSVLIGRVPGDLPEGVKYERAIMSVPKSILIDIPKDVVRQRPDIRKAEIRLMSQTARVGIAEAELYPSLSLGGSFGYSAGSDSLFSSSAKTWSFGPSLRWNIFNMNRTRHLIDAENADLEQARLSYQNTVLLAIEEVENAFISYNEELKRLNSLELSVISAQNSVDIARSQYKAGLINFQRVLDAERVLFFEEDNLVKSQGDLVKHLVSIYRSMGGDWDISIDDNIDLERK